MEKICSHKLQLNFRMLSWLICIACLVSIQQNSLTTADFSSDWISSPNLSPFQRLYSKRYTPHSTCPLAADHLCSEPVKEGKCALPFKKAIDGKSISASNDSRKEAGPSTSSPEVEEPKIIQPPMQPPPIATFDEWTKEKLKLEEKKKNTQHRATDANIPLNVVQNGSPHVSPSEENVKTLPQAAPTPLVLSHEQTRRNYASKECGAKVLFSNDEAENRNAVLNEKETDDYMRNPCERAQHKWLIFELCETIQPTMLELANFELFSSSPHDFRLSGSERYPSNDWIVLGEFQAEDTRSVQRFPITASRVYVKFIRLELLTHYGREHYCTLSLVRLFGVSMVDEYEAEAEAASVPLTESPPTSTLASEAISGKNQESSQQTEEKQPVAATAEPVTDNILAEQKLPETKEPVATKQKDRHIVDTVVDVMGNIGIANIKSAIESAFLRSWKSKSSCKECWNTPMMWACKTCPAPGFRVVPFLFCRAFFRTGRSSIKRSRTLEADAKVPAKSLVEQLAVIPKKKKCEPAARKGRTTRGQKFFLSRLGHRLCPLKNPLEADAVNSTLNAPSDSAGASSKPINVVPATKPSVPQTLPGGTMSHKESVFLKLNKRISALELNMSLSSEYLSELSRRYVGQMNESQKQTEKTLKLAENAATNAVQSMKLEMELQIERLSKDLKEVEELVKAMTGRVYSSQSALKKSNLMEDDEVRRSKYPEPPCKFGEDEHTLSTSQPHILYSNDHLWTTEQLVYMVILAQGCTVALMLLAQCCYNKKRSSELRDLRSVIDEQVSKAVAERSNPADADKAAICPPVAKKKRNRQRKLLQLNLGEAASTASSSMLSVVHPTQEDTSELEIGECAQTMKKCPGFGGGDWESANKTTSREWKAVPHDFLGRPNDEVQRSASAEELSVQSSELSSEHLYVHSSDELQRTPVAKVRSQNDFACSTPVVSPNWQLVVKRRRKKLDRSPFKQVL